MTSLQDFTGKVEAPVKALTKLTDFTGEQLEKVRTVIIEKPVVVEKIVTVEKIIEKKIRPSLDKFWIE